VNHYHRLLQLGLDVRQEGLSWIIKSIWLLGESVNLTKFPKWLDLEACEFLLDVIFDADFVVLESENND